MIPTPVCEKGSYQPPFSLFCYRKQRQGTVNHSQEQWVIGDVHTNSIEGVWDLLKRSIMDTLHKMSRKHMDRYLEEREWHFDNRDNPQISEIRYRK